MKIMNASASTQFSPKRVYSMESFVQTTEYYKKIVYKSLISMRSPSQELLSLAGTFTNVYGRNIELDIVLDKIIDKPIIIKSKWHCINSRFAVILAFLFYIVSTHFV
jgi:hypothetical protein